MSPLAIMDNGTTKLRPGESSRKMPEVEINPQVVQLGPEILARVLDKYLKTQPQLLEAMRHNLDGNAEDLRDAAHSLRGSAATLGLEPMAALCRSLEVAAKDGDLSTSKETLARVLDEGERLEQALSAYLGDLQQQS